MHGQPGSESPVVAARRIVRAPARAPTLRWEAVMPPSRTTRERAQVIERAHADNRAGHDRARQRADRQLPSSHGARVAPR
jgi:hypothetical protein